MPVLSLQLAHQHDTTDEVGPVDREQAVTAFRYFPWRLQRQQAVELDICSPTLYLRGESGEMFFVSVLMAPEDALLEFLLYMEIEEEVDARRWFRKAKKRRRRIESSTGHDEQTAEEAIAAYCRGDIAHVFACISRGRS